MNQATQLYRHRIVAWVGSALLAAVVVYILFGGNPAIDQESARKRLTEWNQALALREELKEFRPSIGYSDVQINGWGYDRQAILIKPKISWLYGGADWMLEAEQAELKPDKLNPKRFVLTIVGTLNLARNGNKFAKLTSSDQLIYAYNESGKDSLNAINHQLKIPKEVTIDFSDNSHSDLTLKSATNETILRLGFMPNIGKMTLSASARDVELYQNTNQAPYEIESLQLNLLENRGSDQYRLGHITLSTRLMPATQDDVSEVEATAEYKADKLYSQIDVLLQKLYAKHPQSEMSLSGNMQFKKNNPTTVRLEMLPSKKIITDDPLNAIIRLFQPATSKSQSL